MSNGKQERNSREYFRITYRPAEAPIFECDNNKFVILDLSEEGIRFSPRKGMQFFEKDEIVGQVVLPNKRGLLIVRGVIIRVSHIDVAVHLFENSRISLAKIMEEQRHLIQQGKL